MNACDNKLKSCLIEMMEQEEAGLKEELQHTKPHVFSAEYRRRMEKAMQVRKRKSKVRSVFRYVAAALVVALLTGGILFIGSEDLHASNMSIDILEWLDHFFTLEDGEDKRKDEDLLFEESRIGYLPEGFEKVGELITFSNIQYKYQKDEEFICVSVCRAKIEAQVDNEEVKKEIYVNEAGLEYTHVYKSEASNSKLIWKDNKGVYYSIESNVEDAELIKMMNGISY